MKRVREVSLPCTMQDFDKSVRECVTVAELMRRLGYCPCGTHYRKIYALVKERGLGTDHWLGQAHGKGQAMKTRVPLSLLLVKGASYGTSNLKDRLVKEGMLKYQCSECGIKEWRGGQLSLQLDHINGIRDDHRLENLRLLCPNCHSQTETYGGRNKPKVEKPQHTCACCEQPISSQGVRCRRCAGKASNPTKVDWPTPDKLRAMVDAGSLLSVAKSLGVSDGAVRNHLR